MKRLIWLGLPVCLATAYAVFASPFTAENVTQQEPTPQPPQQEPDAEQVPQDEDEASSVIAHFMRKKLESSNKILEGLCTNDMTLVTRGAGDLIEMSRAEGWRASNDMLYLHHSREFQRSVQTLIDKANKKSVDGAALAWVDVTMSCIRCHEWVRDTMLAEHAPEPKWSLELAVR